VVERGGAVGDAARMASARACDAGAMRDRRRQAMAEKEVSGGDGRGKGPARGVEGSADLSTAVLLGAVFGALLFRRSSHYPHLGETTQGIADEAADLCSRMLSRVRDGASAAKGAADREGAKALERLAAAAKK